MKIKQAIIGIAALAFIVCLLALVLVMMTEPWLLLSWMMSL